MSELSPVARSVFESFNSKFDWVEDGVPGPQFKAIAAALRAAADQVVPVENANAKMFQWQRERLEQRLITRQALIAIAKELES